MVYKKLLPVGLSVPSATLGIPLSIESNCCKTSKASIVQVLSTTVGVPFMHRAIFVFWTSVQRVVYCETSISKQACPCCSLICVLQSVCVPLMYRVIFVFP